MRISELAGVRFSDNMMRSLNDKDSAFMLSQFDIESLQIRYEASNF